LKAFIESKTVTIIVVLMTVYALFSDDFKNAVTNKGADPYFNIVTLFVLAAFIIEITISSIAIEEYFLSLYFWLDCLATITMITDVTWIWKAIVGEGDVVLDDTQQASNFIRASRSARIGARISRLSRVMRLIRLLRVVRLYKQANSEFNKLNDDNEFKRIVLRHKADKRRRRRQTINDF